MMRARYGAGVLFAKPAAATSTIHHRRGRERANNIISLHPQRGCERSLRDARVCVGAGGELIHARPPARILAHLTSHSLIRLRATRRVSAHVRSLDFCPGARHVQPFNFLIARIHTHVF